MNMQALAAMDDCEHATGKTLEEHTGRRKTPKEVIFTEFQHAIAEAWLCDECFDGRVDVDAAASAALTALRAAGYSIVQVVSTGNNPPPSGGSFLEK